ncbi:MAG: XdhC family protein [Rhodobacteraceae bacterium]|nr:XdhC family protein [Paracoccaceae bacterium]
MTRPAHDRMPETALDWVRAGRGAALATVVETWGSAPRAAGSQLAIAGDGAIEGSVSGGCVEGAVVAEGLAAIADGTSRLLTFGVSDDDAFAVGLACGGTIRVLVDPVGSVLPLAVLEALVAAREGRRPVALVANLAGSERRLTDGQGEGEAGVRARFRTDRSGVEPGGWFVAVHNPPLRMIVVGAVHVAQPLVAMARLAGFEPLIVDPREAFGSAARFPGETIVLDWPDEALAAAGLDARTVVVTLTHDPKLDDPAIRAALSSDVLYLGSLGSSRTHRKRLERLRAAGVEEAALARIHAPVGLDIGAANPAEIALAILAEITSVLRKG